MRGGKVRCCCDCLALCYHWSVDLLGFSRSEPQAAGDIILLPGSWCGHSGAPRGGEEGQAGERCRESAEPPSPSCG